MQFNLLKYSKTSSPLEENIDKKKNYTEYIFILLIFFSFFNKFIFLKLIKINTISSNYISKSYSDNIYIYIKSSSVKRTLTLAYRK